MKFQAKKGWILGWLNDMKIPDIEGGLKKVSGTCFSGFNLLFIDQVGPKSAHHSKRADED
jgi:hypothetical protein